MVFKSENYLNLKINATKRFELYGFSFIGICFTCASSLLYENMENFNHKT